MATPPTFVASYGNAALSTGTKTASVTVQAGDLIVIGVGTNDANQTVGAPSGGGLTYTLQQSIVSLTQQSNAYLWTATSPTAQTFTLSMTGSSGTQWTFSAEVWRNHNGVGSSAKKTATATTSMTLTTQAANSAIVLLNVDWNGVDGTSRSYLSSVGALTEKAYQRLTTIGFYSGYHADSGVVGAKTLGMSTPTGQRPSLIAVEVLAPPVVATGSLSITATALSSSSPPAIRVDVNDTRSPGQATQLTIVRNNPDGTQSPVRTTDGNPLALSGGIGLVYDYEAPLGVPVSYTALEVPSVASLQVTVVSSQVWLVHPGIPSLSISVDLRMGSNDEETWAATRGIFWPMGRSTPVVVTDGARKAPQSTLIFAVDTLTELASIAALTKDAGVVLLNVPASVDLGLTTAYMSFGDISVKRPSSVGADTLRDIAIPYLVVDRPAGGTQSARTYADVLAAFGSYTAELSAYRSYADLLTGP